MTDLTIYADGSITRDGHTVRACIAGTSPRVLHTGLDAWYAGEATRPHLRVDVTHAWGMPDLPKVVAALLADAPLPAGYHMRTRRDGLAMVGRDRP